MQKNKLRYPSEKINAVSHIRVTRGGMVLVTSESYMGGPIISTCMYVVETRWVASPPPWCLMCCLVTGKSFVRFRGCGSLNLNI